MATHDPDELRALSDAVLIRHDTAPANAASVSQALVQAQIDGQPGHGLSRLPSYAAQAKSGKVDGHAQPSLRDCGAAALCVDAKGGFAFPALDLAREQAIERASSCGIGIVAITRSHHCGAVGLQAEKIAQAGLISLIFANAPKAIAPWGGSKALFGTNPIAFACPRESSAPLVIDLSLSKVARGKVMVAAQSGKTIPEGWALDPEGNPTTDPKAAMAGTMLPMGDAKGAALVMMVEILAAALTGAHFGYEASSFFDAEGPPPGVGQTLIAIDPGPLSGGRFPERIETLISAMLEQEGTRLPGSRRLENRLKAQNGGVEVSSSLMAELQQLAAG